jgi:hypothetical protein
MLDRQQIKEHMEVADASGQHVGTVDHLDGDNIKLTRTDSPNGEHRELPLDHLDRIEGGKLYLKEAAQIA